MSYNQWTHVLRQNFLSLVNLKNDKTFFLMAKPVIIQSKEHEDTLENKIINLTGHHIVIIDVNPNNIIRNGGTDYCYEEDIIEIIRKIEPTARLDTFVEGEKIVMIDGVPVAKDTQWRVDNWNTKWKDQWLVVSSLSKRALAANALTKMHKVLVPDKIVRDIRNPSRILGCRGLTTR